MRMNSPANYITLDRAGRRVGRRSRWARLTFQAADCGYVAGLLEQWKRDRSLCVVITCKVGQMVRFGSLKRTDQPAKDLSIPLPPIHSMWCLPLLPFRDFVPSRCVFFSADCNLSGKSYDHCYTSSSLSPHSFWSSLRVCLPSELLTGLFALDGPFSPSCPNEFMNNDNFYMNRSAVPNPRYFKGVTNWQWRGFSDCFWCVLQCPGGEGETSERFFSEWNARLVFYSTEDPRRSIE